MSDAEIKQRNNDIRNKFNKAPKEFYAKDRESDKRKFEFNSKKDYNDLVIARETEYKCKEICREIKKLQMKNMEIQFVMLIIDFIE